MYTYSTLLCTFHTLSTTFFSISQLNENMPNANPVDIQMCACELMQCLPSLILYSLTVCAQCTIPQHNVVCCCGFVCACASIEVLWWCCGTALWLDVALHISIWSGWVPGRPYGALFPFVSYLMHLLTPPHLSAALERHSTPPSVCQIKVHLPNPTDLFRTFNILLYLWLNSVHH